MVILIVGMLVKGLWMTEVALLYRGRYELGVSALEKINCQREFTL